MIHGSLMAHVSRFHFGCVRAMYTRGQVYLTTSAVIALTTRTVYSPWGRQTGDHAETVNKYARRGFRVKYPERQTSLVPLMANHADDPELYTFVLDK